MIHKHEAQPAHLGCCSLCDQELCRSIPVADTCQGPQQQHGLLMQQQEGGSAAQQQQINALSFACLCNQHYLRACT